MKNKQTCHGCGKETEAYMEMQDIDRVKYFCPQCLAEESNQNE